MPDNPGLHILLFILYASKQWLIISDMVGMSDTKPSLFACICRRGAHSP
ncbi:hypothetical protein [uncultured Methanospirillum sp.]